MRNENDYSVVAMCEPTAKAVRVKKIHPDAVIPRKSTPGAAAYDVYLPKDVTLCPGRQIIPLGLSIELPHGYEAKIEPRSGYSAFGMEARLADTHYRINADVLVGKIDEDFRGEIGVIIKADTHCNYVLDKGQRIAQLTIYKVEEMEFEETDSLTETKRGKGGFGSTGS